WASWPLRVVVFGHGHKRGVLVDGDDVRVADDPGPVVAQLLGELERDLDWHPLGDRRLLDLEASSRRPLDLHRTGVDADVDETVGLERFGAGAHGDVTSSEWLRSKRLVAIIEFENTMLIAKLQLEVAMPDRTGKKGWFDADAFHAALDGVRRAKAMNWKEV